MSAAEVGAACATTPGERWGRAAGSVLMALAAALSPSMLCTVPMAVCATFLMIGAITGWCPTQLLKGRQTGRTRRSANTLGYPEAPQDLVGAARGRQDTGTPTSTH